VVEETGANQSSLHHEDGMAGAVAGFKPAGEEFQGTLPVPSSSAADRLNDALSRSSQPDDGEVAQVSKGHCVASSHVPVSVLPLHEFEFLSSYAASYEETPQPIGSLDWYPMLMEASLPSPRLVEDIVVQTSPEPSQLLDSAEMTTVMVPSTDVTSTVPTSPSGFAHAVTLPAAQWVLPSTHPCHRSKDKQQQVTSSVPRQSAQLAKKASNHVPPIAAAQNLLMCN
jgi:hypothetical protein